MRIACLLPLRPLTPVRGMRGSDPQRIQQLYPLVGRALDLLYHHRNRINGLR